MATPPTIQIYPDTSALFAAAADIIQQQLALTLQQYPQANLVLTGGSTPTGLYRLLASDAHRTRINWQRLWVLWGDERNVPLDDPQSNAGVAMHALLQHVPLPPAQVLPMTTTTATDLAATAAAYQQQVQAVLAGGSGQFDVLLLGMGPDGHIASLFPGHPALHLPNDVLVTAISDSPKPPPQRITLTMPALHRATLVLYLVAGSDKARAVAQVLQGSHTPAAAALPAALVQPPQGRVVWLLDEAAAAQVTGNSAAPPTS